MLSDYNRMMKFGSPFVMNETPQLGSESLNLDKETGDMLNGREIVKLHMTVENVKEISETSVDFDEYNEDMFRADIFSVCNADNSSMANPNNYRTCMEIYF